VGGQYLRTTYNRLIAGAAPVRRTSSKFFTKEKYMLTSVFGRFSFRNLSFVFVAAALFSWFVLGHVNASVFFGVASLISMFAHCNHLNDENRFTDIYRAIEDNYAGNGREHDSLYRYIDDRFEEVNRDIQTLENKKR
jgi:hypothetical protein